MRGEGEYGSADVLSSECDGGEVCKDEAIPVVYKGSGLGRGRRFELVSSELVSLLK